MLLSYNQSMVVELFGSKELLISIKFLSLGKSMLAMETGTLFNVFLIYATTNSP